MLAAGVTGLDLTPETVRAQLEPGEAQPTGRIPFTPDAKRALELALRSALTEGDPLIEPRHMLTGIIGTAGRGCEILLTARPDFAEVAPSVQQRPIGLPDTSFRVILLEGEPENWERQLNEAAALGHELVEIVDRRAIFRR